MLHVSENADDIVCLSQISEEPGNGKAIPARDLEIDAAIAIVAGKL